MPSTLEQPIICENLLAPLCEESIRSHLNEMSLNNIRKLHIFPSVDSTNNYLLEKENSSEQVCVCLAEHQTSGRGRYGHQWVSPPGVNLYLSMLWPVKNAQQHFDVLGLWLLLTMAELLEKFHLNNVQLKWPNDICVDKKKLAGVLIERKLGLNKQNLVVGLGVNIAMSVKNNIQIDTPWIDLLSAKPDLQISRNYLSAQVINAFCLILTKFDQLQLTDLTKSWDSYDMLKNRHITFLFNEKKSKGKVLGIDNLGQIIIEINGKPEHLHSSYVSKLRLVGASV